jgi:hypothetical protein
MRITECRGVDVKTALAGCGCGCFRRQIGLSNTICTNPLVTGELLTEDPGFENHINLTGSAQIPFAASTNHSSFIYSDNSPAPLTTRWSSSAKGALFYLYTTRTQEIVTTDPHSGTYHIKTTCQLSTGQSAYTFAAVLFRNCSGVGRYSAVVESGSVITFSGWGKDGSGAGGSLDISVTFYDESDVFIDSDSLFGVTATTSYQQLQLSTVAPANTKFIRAGMQVSASTTLRTYYIDDCSLVVS